MIPSSWAYGAQWAGKPRASGDDPDRDLDDLLDPE